MHLLLIVYCFSILSLAQPPVTDPTQWPLTREAALKERSSGAMPALKTVSDVVTGHVFAITSTWQKHRFWE
jgi:hypothetical protein